MQKARPRTKLLYPFDPCLHFGTGRDNASVEVRLDKAIALEAGSRFAIREGGKTIGSGVVSEVLA